MLEKLNANKKMSEPQYQQQVGKAQVRLRELEFDLFKRQVPVLCLFEGWDAAGKGGAIKRVTEMLDPRGFTVLVGNSSLKACFPCSMLGGTPCHR